MQISSRVASNILNEIFKCTIRGVLRKTTGVQFLVKVDFFLDFAWKRLGVECLGILLGGIVLCHDNTLQIMPCGTPQRVPCRRFHGSLACSCAPYSSTETNHTYAGSNQFEKMVVLQPWTKYLRQYLVFMWNNALRENFNFFDKIFILGGRLGLGTRIWFYEDFRFSWSFLISWDPKSEVVWQLVRQPLYTIFSTNNHALFYLR